MAALISYTASGLFLAPLLIVGWLSADTRAALGALTESSSWFSTSITLGAALGATVFGTVADAVGPRIALAFNAAAAEPIVASCAPSLLRAQRPSR